MGLFRKNKFKKKYIVHEELGRGSFAVVKRCEEKATGKEYAVKMIFKSELKEKSDKEMLQNEVDILKAIDHENVIHLQETFEGRKKYYIVMELLSGGDVFERIAELQKYTEGDAMDLAYQVLEALDYIHEEKNIIHRDLKPENLILADSSGSVVKVADFGLSRFKTPDQALKTTCGTPHYVAPEILKRAFGSTQDPYDTPVDMWSFGVILYVLLCGFPPFHDDNTQALFKLIMKGKLDFPSPEWDDVSKEGRDLVSKILVTDPKRRLTAAEALDHPWFKGKAESRQLKTVTKNIAEFNAKRKWKKAAEAVLAVDKLKNLAAHMNKDGGRKSSGGR